MSEILSLFTTNVGSHMWKMDHEHSDIDLTTVHIMQSYEFLLGKTMKGRQTFNKITDTDTTFYELGHFINNLKKGNVNFLWAVMSPIIVSDNSVCLKELRQIVATTLSKHTYYSINGLAKHNVYHFIKDVEVKDRKYYKKLNLIGRTLQFGINLLRWNKCMFEKVNIKDKYELYELQNQLNIAFENSKLPNVVNEAPFDSFLIKQRLRQLRKDGFMEAEK